MSGGFYGVSSTLANKMVESPHLSKHMRGIEDLQTGLLIKAVTRPEGGNVDILSWENGVNWCHFKDKKKADFAMLSGEELFHSDDCNKR